MHVADTAGTINTISPSSLRAHLQLRGEALSTALVWAVFSARMGTPAGQSCRSPTRGGSREWRGCSCGGGCVVPAVHHAMHKSRLYT